MIDNIEKILPLLNFETSDDFYYLQILQRKKENPPNICKKESKNIEIRKDWEDIKLEVMYKLLVKKFTQEPFKSKLLATGNENIQEGNFWNDTFWGVDLKQNPNVGENNLGRLIMYIRILLKQGKL